MYHAERVRPPVQDSRITSAILGITSAILGITSAGLGITGAVLRITNVGSPVQDHQCGLVSPVQYLGSPVQYL